MLLNDDHERDPVLAQEWARRVGGPGSVLEPDSSALRRLSRAYQRRVSRYRSSLLRHCAGGVREPTEAAPRGPPAPETASYGTPEYRVLEEWAALKIGAAILPKSKVTSSHAYPIKDKAGRDDFVRSGLGRRRRPA